MVMGDGGRAVWSRKLVICYLILFVLGGFLSEIYASESNWFLTYPPQAPSPRIYHDMVYDSARDRVVLFGGSVGQEYSNETWEYNGSTWNRIECQDAPSPRGGHKLVFDSARGRVVLFGGRQEKQFSNETWEYDGFDWIKISTKDAPSARAVHGMAFDSCRGVTVLFGGYSGMNGRNDETWEYDGFNWELKSPPMSPPPREDFAMTFDSSRNLVVIYGGKSKDGLGADNAQTWEYDGSNWVEVVTSSTPGGRVGARMVSTNHRVILLGGLQSLEGWSNRLDDMWRYNGCEWTQMLSNNAPSPKFGHAMVYDSRRHLIICYGGGAMSFETGSVFLSDDTFVCRPRP